MAQFWAMEESQGPKSWDDEQELDYSVIASKRLPNEEIDTSNNSGTGTGRSHHNNIITLLYMQATLTCFDTPNAPCSLSNTWATSKIYCRTVRARPKHWWPLTMLRCP